MAKMRDLDLYVYRWTDVEKQEPKKKKNDFHSIYIYIYIFHTHCVGGMHTEFMVTGCLWGARVGKRTEQVKKRRGASAEGVCHNLSPCSVFWKNFSKTMNSEEKVN